MDSTNVYRRAVKIRRTGRHTAPSQVEKVAEKAGKAAPAMAIAGALVAMPQAHAAAKAPAKTTTVAEQATTDALVRTAHHAGRSYTVRSGDTLSSIAKRFYGNTARWRWIYDANRSKISNPNQIYAGETLTIPYAAPSTSSYTPRHARGGTTLTSSAQRVHGRYTCAGLETLWRQAGGRSSQAFIAAEIAMAESGGNPWAHSPTNDFGLWQINGGHGPRLATYDPLGNARAAVAISSNGHNWFPWTTYTSGAYRGRC